MTGVCFEKYTDIKIEYSNGGTLNGGVAILVLSRIAQKCEIVELFHIDKRAVAVKINYNRWSSTLINVYAPSSNSDERRVFFTDLKKTMEEYESEVHKNIIVAGILIVFYTMKTDLGLEIALPHVRNPALKSWGKY